MPVAVAWPQGPSGMSGQGTLTDRFPFGGCVSTSKDRQAGQKPFVDEEGGKELPRRLMLS